MKIRYYISFLLLFALFSSATANDDIRILANKCLSLANNVKVSEAEFRQSLKDIEVLCKTKEEKQYFEEFSLLAEKRFNTRPLIAAVTTFTCEDPSLAMVLKPSALAQILETSLDESYIKVTRKDIDKAIEELKLQSSDLFDPSTGVKIGSFVGAQYIISGNIQKVSEKIVITARVIEVKTGKIVKTGILKDLKNAGEAVDAIPSLAAQLSIKSKQKAADTLSGHVIKYLNIANKKLVSEDFNGASYNIMHSNMFLEGKKIRNTLVSLQTAMTATTCFQAQRNYNASLEELNNSLDFAKDIFGETDDFVIHYYYKMAKNHFQNGNLDQAASAYQRALGLFERTAEAKKGAIAPFVSLGDVINRRINKVDYNFNKKKLEEENNDIILTKFQIKAPTVKKPVAPSVSSTPDSVQSITQSNFKETNAQIQPQTSTRSQIPEVTTTSGMSGEIRALLRNLENSSKQNQWAQMSATANKIFAKEPNNQAAKQIMRDYIAKVIRNAEKQFKAKQYSEAAQALIEIKSELDIRHLRLIAMCYEKIGDIQEAEKYYSETAKRNDNVSLMWLARNAVRNGNSDEAIRLYEKIAANGYTRAYLLLSFMYLSKRQGFYDEEKGLRYMKLAAEAGVPAAQYNLGCCYANFPGATYASIPYDKDKAIKWLQKAKENGIKSAAKALDRLK